MTVGELKKLLQNVPDERMVILSGDSEGNKFSPLYEVSAEDDLRYAADNSWSGELIGEDEGEGTPAIALWPTN
jgi:hypothetical protein